MPQPITFKKLQEAAKVLNRLSEILMYVSRERFDAVAKIKGITDGRTLDVMYGMLFINNLTIRQVAKYENKEKDTFIPDYLSLMPKALEIVEEAYSLCKEGYDKNVPCIEYGDYRRSDIRRYYYTDENGRAMLDVNLGSESSIQLIAELLKRDGVKIEGVAKHLGYLEKVLLRTGERKKINYFDGDIYFLFGMPQDRLFYSYFNADHAGVYVATPKGWRKLLYTPTRGYVTKDGKLDFADEDRYYSDYMLESSGKDFRYVGNVYDNKSVLYEKNKEG